ncbi:MAG: endonuclease/exonuclease/phosphatase family protein [Planctomycetes bacterium]|nr:endonuclease/exonuclease/phosphatase family protein [Planctomycetota bacterium]
MLTSRHSLGLLAGLVIALAPAAHAATAPTVTPDGGTFPASVFVSLYVPPVANAPATDIVDIHYTLDGSTPTTASPVFNPPLVITGPGAVTLKTMAFDRQTPRGASAVVTRSFTISAPPTTTTMLRLANWNVRSARGTDGMGSNYPRIAKYLINSDVITLNETNGSGFTDRLVDQMKLLTPGVTWYQRQFSPDAGMGNSIISRFPFTYTLPQDHRVFAAKENGSKPYAVDHVALDVNGKTVHYCATRVTYSDPIARQKQIVELKEFLDQLPGPRFVAGDFNANPTSTTTAWMLNPTAGTTQLMPDGTYHPVPMTRYVSCWLEAKGSIPSLASWFTGNPGNGTHGGSTLDYIMVAEADLAAHGMTVRLSQLPDDRTTPLRAPIGFNVVESSANGDGESYGPYKVGVRPSDHNLVYAIVEVPRGAIANRAPSVAVTAPAAGTSLVAPTTFAIQASASDSDGSIAKVEFLADGVVVGVDTTAPYTCTWNSSVTGAHTLVAKATDNRGATTTSAAVGVTIAAAAPTWSSRDIGTTGLVGATSVDSGVYTISGAGSDLYGTSESFRFVHRTLTGDGTLIARVTSVQNVAEWSMAGIMIRASLDANAPHANLIVTHSGERVKFRTRASVGGSTASNGPGPGSGLVFPQWLKLVRTGDVITGYRASDAPVPAWVQVGSITIAMGSSVQVGMLCTSTITTALCLATIDQVSLSGVAAGPSSFGFVPVDEEGRSVLASWRPDPASTLASWLP